MPQRGGNISWRGNVADQEKYCDAGESSGSGNYSKHARSPANPIAAFRHGGAEQQSHRGIAGHRIVFLRRGKRKEDQYESDPAKRQQPRASGTIDGLERKFRDSREVHAPREQPEKMKQPEPDARNRVVIARISQIKKPQYLFVDKIEPKKAVILARATVQRK